MDAVATMFSIVSIVEDESDVFASQISFVVIDDSNISGFLFTLFFSVLVAVTLSVDDAVSLDVSNPVSVVEDA